MGTWNSRGLRGSALEDFINLTNEEYRRSRLGLIQKVPTPITPIRIDKESRHITLAYFDQKSTVDYIGVIQGIPVCFDAKECQEDTFPLANVHEHQIDFMRQFEEQDGVAFLLLGFSSREQYYYMTYRELERFWFRAQEGGRKSIRFDELDPAFFFKRSGCRIPYLDLLQADLDKRAEEEETTEGMK